MAPILLAAGAALRSFGAHPGTWFAGAAIAVVGTWGLWQKGARSLAESSLEKAKAALVVEAARNDQILARVERCNASVLEFAKSSADATRRAADALRRADERARRLDSAERIARSAIGGAPAGAGCEYGDKVVREALEAEIAGRR